MASGDVKFESPPIGMESEDDSISGTRFVLVRNLGSVNRDLRITIEYPTGSGISSSIDGPLDFDHNYTVKIIEN